MNSTECSCRGEFQVAAESEALVQETMTRLRPHFRRREAHQHAADYLRGLIADLERKNGWQLAEQAGYRHPRGMQRVLERYTWDHQAVREDLRQYVVTELGDPDGVLVVDETGFVKTGETFCWGGLPVLRHPGQNCQLSGGSVPGLGQSQGSYRNRWCPLRA